MERIRELRLMSRRFLCASSLALGALAGLSTPVARAQASSSEVPTPTERARLLAEQSKPRKEVPFNPADFDKFVGYYTQGDPVAFLHVFRTGDHYYAQINSASPAEFLPDSPTEFFATKGTAQITFVTGPDGRVTEMINHQNGYLRPWLRSSESAYDAFETSLKQRIAENIPSPGAEAAIRRQIEEGERTGHVLYAQMTPLTAANYREQSAQFEATLKRMGALQSLRFVKVWPPNGHDEYLATFAHGQLAVVTAPLTPDGKITVLEFRPLP